ncbi:L-type lectin-domain containing receptor kinase V.9-like [Rhododendron vialii]|uniref:L-type lectin-domain containing receptor kinase V.9-like n=1 Tax=Rhododendron vialii TaxID=182163 RepID=UPI00265F6B08|nr:L-type lectin-domain containing receptor kinase V.9-like [Rhododendron vialii]
MNCCIAILLLLLLKFATSSSSNNIPDDFTFNGCLKLDGRAELGSNGLFTLNESAEGTIGHAFYSFPIQFKKSLNASVISFSTTFIIAIVSANRNYRGDGLAFVISPNKEIPGAFPSQYLGLFNSTNMEKSSNHIVAVELDTFLDYEFHDIDDNHVGININSLLSIKSAPAGYFIDRNGSFRNLSLKSGDPMQVWVEYDGINRQLNVTMSPIHISKPALPLLSLTKDLSPFLLEYMYVGFSSSTGLLQEDHYVLEDHYILGLSFKMNGQAQQIDLSRLPKLPQRRQVRDDKQIKRILAIALPPIAFLLLLVLIFGSLFMTRMKKLMEVLEDWEVQYGPHRFGYKDLFIATKGFKDRELLGQGGFGRVYRGVLPTSNIQVAVKRVAHDSRQGLREFVAEIATIGRLRHPNLVRLLGYCRRKQELLLVYDYMPNGSLDRFLYGQPKGTLNWMQRFKIIKDVASGLLYLHQQWVQVIIHRDIKASNVLIDDEFNGRLGDFGLAKFCDHGTDLQTSHVAGTLGYIAPELARNGKASTSTDLFAFGAFMLEVVCGRRPVDPRASPKEVILVDWVFECLERGNILEAIDRQLGTEYAVEEAELVLKLGLLCSHSIAAARPSMSTVVQYLEGRPQLPDNLGYIIKSRNFGQASNEQDVQLPTSVTSLTISEPFTSTGR